MIKYIDEYDKRIAIIYGRIGVPYIKDVFKKEVHEIQLGSTNTYKDVFEKEVHEIQLGSTTIAIKEYSDIIDAIDYILQKSEKYVLLHIQHYFHYVENVELLEILFQKFNKIKVSIDNNVDIFNKLIILMGKQEIIEELYISCNDINFSVNEIMNLLNISTLKNLHLSSKTMYENPKDICLKLAKSNLKKLHIGFGFQIDPIIQNMSEYFIGSHISSLSFSYCEPDDVMNLLTKNDYLREFKVLSNYVDKDNIVKTICELFKKNVKLESFSAGFYLKESNIVSIIRSLYGNTHLKKLKLNDHFECNEYIFKKLLTNNHTIIKINESNIYYCCFDNMNNGYQMLEINKMLIYKNEWKTYGRFLEFDDNYKMQLNIFLLCYHRLQKEHVNIKIPKYIWWKIVGDAYYDYLILKKRKMSGF